MRERKITGADVLIWAIAFAAIIALALLATAPAKL